MQMLIYPLIVILGFFAYSYDWQTIQNDTISLEASRNMGASLKIYRRAVANYADSNPGFDGAVSDIALGLPAWYRKIRGMGNVITGGRVYVYFDGGANPEPLPALREMMGVPSALVGIKRSGRLVSPAAMTTVALPTAIPEGSIVFML